MGSWQISNSGQPPEIQLSTSSHSHAATADGHNNHLMNIDHLKAARNGSVGIFKAIIDAGPNSPETIFLSRTSHRKDTLLHIAAVFGHRHLAQFLASKFPELLFNKNFKGDTPLHVAAKAGHLPVVEVLVPMQLPRNDSLLAVNEDGNTPLHEAIVHNQHNVVRFFLGVQDFRKAVFCVNAEGKSSLYLIVESGNAQNLKDVLNILGSISQIELYEQVKTGKSIVHAAINGKDIGLMEAVAVGVPQLFNENDHPLHLAALLGFLEGVKYLLTAFPMEVFSFDDDGLCPIHLASKYGRLKVIQELLDHYPDAREFLSKNGQNILHVAAENGKDNIVHYILANEGAELLLNEKDDNGDTPLHLATRNWHPKVVSTLTWDSRVDLKLVDKEGLTALEVAETYMEIMPPFKKRLTWMALRSAGTPRAQHKDADTVKRLQAAKYEPYNMDYCKDRVNTLLLVSALVATVTFAAGFTMPGGYKNSGKHEGMAAMVHTQSFHLFVICDSIAVYSSIIVAVMLMWAQLGDLNLLLNSLRTAQRLLGLSLTMMSLAFMAGVDLVVTELPWLSGVILGMGIVSLITLLALFIPLFLPYTSKYIVARYISYYPFRWLMLASES